MEEKIQIMHHVLKIHQISLFSKYIKLISRGVFLCVFMRGNTEVKRLNSGILHIIIGI